MTKNRYWIVGILLLVLGVSVAWFPHSLARVKALGYDFTIFYVGPSDPGWFYAPWVSIFLEPLRIFPHDIAFAIHYTVSALAYCVLILAVARRRHRLAFAVGLLGLYPYLLSQELGALTVVLAALCLTWPGALLAGCFKPYLFVFAGVHAIRKLLRDRATRTWRPDATVVQDESDVPGHFPGDRNSMEEPR